MVKGGGMLLGKIWEWRGGGVVTCTYGWTIGQGEGVGVVTCAYGWRMSQGGCPYLSRYCFKTQGIPCPCNGTNTSYYQVLSYAQIKAPGEAVGKYTLRHGVRGREDKKMTG